VKDFKWIIKENIPCWYELSWLKEKVSILLRIHQDFANAAPVMPKDSPLVNHFLEDFQFSHWSCDLKKDFGFDNAFVFQQEKEGFVEFLVPIPKIRKYVGKPCRRCKGTGIDNIMKGFGENKKCVFCNGTGKEYFMDWRPAQAISASFNAFLTLAFHPDLETSAPFPQLMTIQVTTAHDMHGGSLGGEFSIPFYEWLSSFEERTAFPDVIEAIQVAAKKMFGKVNKYEGFGFRAYMLRRGGIVINVPGDACGIYNLSDSYDDKRKRGCRFECHNVDTAMQQLELLVGLAVLHDRARKEIKI